MSYAKFCNNHYITNRKKTKWNYHQIWNAMENQWVQWTHGGIGGVGCFFHGSDLPLPQVQLVGFLWGPCWCQALHESPLFIQMAHNDAMLDMWYNDKELPPVKVRFIDFSLGIIQPSCVDGLLNSSDSLGICMCVLSLDHKTTVQHKNKHILYGHFTINLGWYVTHLWELTISSISD